MVDTFYDCCLEFFEITFKRGGTGFFQTQYRGDFIGDCRRYLVERGVLDTSLDLTDGVLGRVYDLIVMLLNEEPADTWRAGLNGKHREELRDRLIEDGPLSILRQ